jgi:hypothetical protein
LTSASGEDGNLEGKSKLLLTFVASVFRSLGLMLNPCNGLDGKQWVELECNAATHSKVVQLILSLLLSVKGLKVF